MFIEFPEIQMLINTSGVYRFRRKRETDQHENLIYQLVSEPIGLQPHIVWSTGNAEEFEQVWNRIIEVIDVETITLPKTSSII